MGLLINIDNGGTFTDICVHGDRRVLHAKATTTPHDLTQCFVDGLRKASARVFGEEDLPRLLREADYLRYSTTAGTNAVVERKSAPVALLVEAGEEHAAYGARKSASTSGLWSALVAGEPIGLAVSADGKVDADELTDKVNCALATGAQRMVIALRSAAAERDVKSQLLEKYPRHLLGALPFVLSYELSPHPDAALRTTTALLNAYLHPPMEQFLYGADRVCRNNRLGAPLLIFRNDGNSARVAKTTAIKTWGSGPRGGLEGTLAYANLYKAATMVSMDIGGTTTDVAVAVDGKIDLHAVGEIEDAPVAFPLPALRSHGLGGSSIYRVEGKRIHIGPQSVGAAPGPACFERGGTQATLTDALLLAGVIDGDNHLGGELKLDPARAREAIREHVAEPLGLELDAAVDAMIAAAAEAAADALKDAVESKARKPAGATLLAFGGAGPIISTRIADAAGIRRVIVPHMSAVFSAFGIGFSDLAHQYRQPMPKPQAMDAAKADMLERARRDMFGEGVDPDRCDYRFSAQHVVDSKLVELPLADAAGTDATLILRAAYGLPSFALAEDAPAGAGKTTVAPNVGKTKVHSADGKSVEVPVISADALKPGQGAEGPVLVRGEYMTCLVDAGWALRISANQDLLIERKS